MKLKPHVERPIENTRLHMAELKRFKQLDLNHDGTVSLDEWREYMKREDPDATEEEVQATFYSMDENQDGEVQFEESIKHAAINIKRSIAALKSWNGDMATNTPGTLKGYYALTMYALFFGIFVYVVIEQLKIEDQYPIDQVVRNTLLDQDGAMSTIAAHEDFFNYLLADFDPKTQKFKEETYPNGGVFSTLFKDEHYNGEKLAPGDLGMLYQYNKLVGGVQISQKRGKLKECPPSSYALFYPTCYDKEEMITAEPCRATPGEYQDCKLVVQNTTRANKVCGTDDMKMQLDQSQTELYNQYLKDVKASQFGDRASLEKGKSKIVKESFEYRYDEEGGFVAWLSLADGPDLNRKKIQTLKDELWLDLYTREVSVKFIFYNGNAGTFSYVSISFTFNTYGMYNTYNPDYSSVQRRGSGGSRIEIGSLNMEPYITAEDHGRLGVELVFMIFVFYYVASLLFDVVLAIYHRKVYQFVEAYGLAYLVMDVANMSCHLAFIVYRIDILRHIICNPVRVPTPSYNLVFEELSTKRQEQLMINFWSILLGMLRFFKYYQFQPRLQVITYACGCCTYLYMLRVRVFLCMCVCMHVKCVHVCLKMRGTCICRHVSLFLAVFVGYACIDLKHDVCVYAGIHVVYSTHTHTHTHVIHTHKTHTHTHTHTYTHIISFSHTLYSLSRLSLSLARSSLFLSFCLQIVGKTLTAAAVHLFHFMVRK